MPAEHNSAAALPDNDRRSFVIQAGASAAVAAAAAITPRKSGAQVIPTPPPSPPTQPWVEELPVQRPLQPQSNLSPEPQGSAGSGECGRANHQAWGAFPPQEFYQVDIKEGQHNFHRELPTQTVWGYNGTVPGPLFHARYGRPMVVRFRNQLPPLAQGYGAPEVSVHLHNLHTPSESDGYPVDWFSPSACGSTLAHPGDYKDHHYPMVCAGVEQYGGIGDAREALGTLWYHDHRTDFTAPNVYRGMAGFFLAFDELDSGNEQDTNPLALRLPSGDYDVPLLLADKRFDSGGYLAFDQFNGDGFIGDKFTVNGKVQPVWRVERRKYRLRILDGGPARFYDLQLRLGNAAQSFSHIANDGNLLPAPLTRSSVRLGPAERADIVVDFSRYGVGTELLLVNRLNQLDGRKPEKDLLATPTPLMKIIVDHEPREPDVSRVPAALRELPPINTGEAVRTRSFEFGRSGGAWTINERIFNNRAVASPVKGTAEIWVLRNLSGGWAHPVHIHFEEGRILARNGATPPAHERGRKDVFVIGPSETVRVFLRFRDYEGKYVMHCHNTVHEDHAMMARWDIVAA
jgi:FtsP/CotA-like multicopper oxidase with cupredoxin domain